MPRKGGASGPTEVSRKRRKKSWIDANKKRSRRAKLRKRNPVGEWPSL